MYEAIKVMNTYRCLSPQNLECVLKYLMPRLCCNRCSVQVPEVVHEQMRYGGELTGIRANLSRSVKIK